SKIKLGMILLSSALAIAASNSKGGSDKSNATQKEVSKEGAFDYNAEAFADLQILRYQVPGWEQLTPQQKEFIYYLSEASLAGRDIIWDQRGKYNLTVRKVIEAIYGTYKGAQSGADWENFKTYAGQIWFS